LRGKVGHDVANVGNDDVRLTEMLGAQRRGYRDAPHAGPFRRSHSERSILDNEAPLRKHTEFLGGFEERFGFRFAT
jgi:hypothetical protein